MLITIEDFEEEHFDEILEILERGLETVRFRYASKEVEFGKELLLNEFLSYPAKISKCCGMIKAGANLNKNASLHIHDNTAVGREAARKLARDIEDAAKDAGNELLYVFTLVGHSDHYLNPFQGYDVLNRSVGYPLGRKPEEGSMRLTRLEKALV